MAAQLVSVILSRLYIDIAGLEIEPKKKKFLNWIVALFFKKMSLGSAE